MDPEAIHHASWVFTVSSAWCRQAPTALLAPEYRRSVPTTDSAGTLKTVMRSGAISEPAPIPVAPTRMPTISPAMTSSTPTVPNQSKRTSGEYKCRGGEAPALVSYAPR